MGVAEVVVKYVSDTKDLAGGLAKAESASKSTGDRIKGMGRVALAAAGAAGLGALVYTLKAGVDEFTNASKVSAQTNAVIKSTGGVANVSARHVDALANSLLQKSGVDDEAIQSGENLLLTFRGIQNQAGKGNKIFDQATRTMLDMSVALGQDTTKSAMQLGKALQDPVKGVSTLRRVGVIFTAAQKDQIKALVASGHTMDAQKIILGELNKEFGGSAEAAGKTLPGQLSILRENFNNLAGVLVGKLAPVLGKVAEILTKHPALFQAIVVVVLALAAAMVALNIALAITAALEASVLWPALLVIAALAALVAVAVLVYKNWDKITAAINGAVDAIKTGLSVAFEWLKANWPLVVGILMGPFGLAIALIVTHWSAITSAIKGAASAALGWLRSNWPLVLGILTGPFGLALALIATHWSQITAAASSAVSTIKSVWSGLVSWLSGAIGDISYVIGRIKTIFGGLDDPVVAAVNAIKGALATIPTYLTGLVERVSGAAHSVANAIKAPINAVIAAWNGLAFHIPKVTLPSVKIPHVGKIGGGSFGGQVIGFPNLPKLAAGGIVTAPTLAVLGERGPEAVVPLGSSAPPVEVRVFIGDTELRGLVRTEVRTESNRTAQVLLAGA